MSVLSRLLYSLQRHHRALTIALLICTSLGALHAQATVNDDNASPPSRVARLSYIVGDIGFLPAGAQDWSDASVNRPLTTGDRLSSSQHGRAELEFGGAVLRMDGRSDVELLDLNEKIAQIELSQGTLSLSVLHLDPGQTYEIDTPTVALVIDQPGTFRVDINDDGGSSSTRITAFNADATVYGENNTRRQVYSGRSYRFVDSSLSAVAISDIGGGDSFDAWVSSRERRYALGDNSQYVPDDMVGTPDLREYGAWDNSSEYGPVWYPNDVGPDWAPYRTGHWAYIAPWGWTWIDAMPWGYAPYHYGRWAHTGRGWGWIPGPRDVRSIYAPALVVFVGGGVSVGFGSPVGWFPLGPGEIYNPWYHCDRDYYTRVNMSDIRRDRQHDDRSIANRIDDHYAHYRDNRPLHVDRYVNRDAPHGLTAMPGRDFAASQAVQRHLLRGDRQLASAPVRPLGAGLRPLPGNPAVVHSTPVGNLPLSGFRHEVVVRHVPPQQAVEPIARMAGPAHPVMPVARVPGLKGGEPDRSQPYYGTASTGIRPNAPRSSNVIANAPVVPGRADDVTGSPAPPRLYEPSSARFAHPSGNRAPERLDRQPRPSVSFIAPERPSAASQPYSRPPQTPRIEPAAEFNRAAPREAARQPTYSTPQPRMYRPSDAAPRMGTATLLRPADIQAPRPMPPRNEAPRQMMQAERYMPPRSAPPVRAEAARAQPRQAPASNREEPRKQNDGHQR